MFNLFSLTSFLFFELTCSSVFVCIYMCSVFILGQRIFCFFVDNLQFVHLLEFVFCQTHIRSYSCLFVAFVKHLSLLVRACVWANLFRKQLDLSSALPDFICIVSCSPGSLVFVYIRLLLFLFVSLQRSKAL